MEIGHITKVTRRTFAATGLAGALILASMGAAAPASAAFCTTLSIPKTSVRPGGVLPASGRTCAPAGASASSQRVVIKLNRSKSWKIVKRTPTSTDGRFSACLKLRVPRRTRVARLQATGPGGSSRISRVRVSPQGRSSCHLKQTTTTTTTTTSSAPTTTTTTTTDPAPVDTVSTVDQATCALGTVGSTIPMALGGCTTVASDTASNADPTPFWGNIECASSLRHQQITTGGDSHSVASGAAQPDSAYRRLTVLDGDNFWGERCELGLNDHNSGPTAFYGEGQRRVTYASVRLPDNFKLDQPMWQAVMQMKQAQPSDGGGGTPILALEAFDGRWRLRQSNSAGPSSDAHEIWSAPAQKNVWTRFALDITYSQDASKGKIVVNVDLNGDGDFDDSEERSETINTYTLKYEVDGPNGSSDGYSPGQSIASHLRMGVYHNPNYSCPPPTGCSVDIDDVQVVKA